MIQTLDDSRVESVVSFKGIVLRGLKDGLSPSLAADDASCEMVLTQRKSVFDRSRREEQEASFTRSQSPREGLLLDRASPALVLV